MFRRIATGLGMLICLGLMAGHRASSAAGDRLASEALPAQIASLQAADVAWREIPWKSCLLEGLQQSREQGKPALLWVFIDRPVDDARC